MEGKISANQLRLFYGTHEALKGISLTVQPKTVMALIGPSGCGKSTFLRTLNRMNDLIPSVLIEGEVRVDGENIYHPMTDVVALRKKVGMSFNSLILFP